MIICLVCFLGLLLPPISSLQSSDKCWFVYDPSDGRSLQPDVVPLNKEITGVITIDTDVLWQNIGEEQLPGRAFTLQFMKTDGEQPLVLAIDERPEHDTQLVLWGEINGQGELEFWEPNPLTLFPNSNVRIQITDKNSTSEQSYKLIFNGQRLSFNYKLAKNWQKFEDMPLNTTTKIKYTDTFNWTRRNFLSVCSDPKPVLCDADQEVTINAVLGANYTLSCSGKSYFTPKPFEPKLQ